MDACIHTYTYIYFVFFVCITIRVWLRILRIIIYYSTKLYTQVYNIMANNKSENFFQQSIYLWSGHAIVYTCMQ